MTTAQLASAVVLALFVAIHLPAQPPMMPQATPPISESELVRRLQSRIDSLTAKEQFSGVILLARDGHVVFEKPYGYADREARRRNTIETTFNAQSASCSRRRRSGSS